MKKQKPHIIPSIYLANYLNDFEELILHYDVQRQTMKKGDYLTTYGVINNTAYYVKRGIIHLSQSELAKIAGVSQAQMERSVKLLKEKGVLTTSRKQLTIIDEQKLLDFCTAGMKNNSFSLI